MWKFILIALMLPACLPKSKSQVASVDESLVISGSVATPSGTAAVGTRVYLEDQQDAAAEVDADGQFTIKISETALRILENKLIAKSRSGHRLYFVNTLNNWAALSDEIPVGARGSIVEEVDLELGRTISGKVSFYERYSSSIQPGDGAKVKLGRWETLADEKGNYKFTGVPRDELLVQVSAVNYRSWQGEVDLSKIDFQNTLDSITLFSEAGVTGAILIDDRALAIQGGDALSRIFSVRRHSEAAYIRVSEDIRSLQVDGTEDVVIIEPGLGEDAPPVAATITPAQWFPVADFMNFSFSELGAKQLYYQFANSSKQERSAIHSYAFVLDVFPKPSKVVLNLGKEISISSNVQVELTIPEGAVGMRYGETLEELEEFEAVPPVESFIYSFKNDLKQEWERDFFIQFIDDLGREGQVYERSVKLDLFPDNDELEIATVVEGQVVTVEVEAPVTASEFRISATRPDTKAEEELEEVPEELLWQPVALVAGVLKTSYEFEPSGLESRTLYLQFRDANGNESLAYPIYVNIIQ